MTGILLCALALVVALVAMALLLVRERLAAVRDWPFWLVLAVIVTEVALEWGNVGVIYSHAGFTG